MAKINKTTSGKYSVRLTIKEIDQSKQVQRTFKRLSDTRYFLATNGQDADD